MSAENFEEDLEYWKNRCLQIEEKLSGREEDPLKEELKEVRNGLADLESRWSNRINCLSEKMQENDQYHKRNSIIIRGYKYNLPNLNNFDFIHATACELNNLFPSMRIPIHPLHIDDAHPLRNKKTLIVKFSNRWVKNEVIRCKDDLEGLGLSVTEHLTPHTLELMSSAEKIVGKSNVWVHNTLVFAKYHNIRYLIRTAKDLNYLSKSVSTPSSSSSPPQPHTNSLDNSVSQKSQDSQESIVATESPVITPTPLPHSLNPIQHTDNYFNEYPALFNSLFHSNDTYTKTSTMRGKPSRNGRGRRPTRGTYNVRNRNY